MKFWEGGGGGALTYGEGEIVEVGVHVAHAATLPAVPQHAPRCLGHGGSVRVHRLLPAPNNGEIMGSRGKGLQFRDEGVVWGMLEIRESGSSSGMRLDNSTDP